METNPFDLKTRYIVALASSGREADTERQLYRVLKAYIEYFNQQRPHQGINQARPALGMSPSQLIHDKSNAEVVKGKVIALPILGGLHHSYERAA